MKIINLQAENIKKLTAIDITPKSEVIHVTGPNGAGKTSVLDCITMALCGGREIPAIPIKNGEDNGSILIDLGDYQITRTFKGSNTYLKIEALDGEKITSPQKFLDKIVGDVSFDPLEFMNHEVKKQRDIILSLVGVDIDAFDKREKEAYDNRTLSGKEVNKLKAAYEAIPFHPELQGEQVSAPETLIEKIQAAMSHNKDLDDAQTKNEDLKVNAINFNKELDKKRVQITELQEEVKRGEEKIEKDRATYKETKTRLENAIRNDITQLQAQLTDISGRNAKIEENARREKAKADFKTAEDEYKDLDAELESIRKERAKALLDKPMPIPGLSVSKDGLLFNDVPLSQCSDGEKLMISLSISMALNPTLKVLRIKDGSLLDKQHRDIITQAVKDKGYQLWFESVADQAGVGIYIEEGEIKQIDDQVVTPREKKKESRKKKDTQVSTKEEKSQEPQQPAPVIGSDDEW